MQRRLNVQCYRNRDGCRSLNCMVEGQVQRAAEGAGCCQVLWQSSLAEGGCSSAMLAPQPGGASAAPPAAHQVGCAMHQGPTCPPERRLEPYPSQWMVEWPLVMASAEPF